MQTPKKRPFRRLSQIQPIKLITLSFLVIIIAGTILLLLPISTREGQSTSLLDALFTSTSATCVTGLVIVDTYLHWTAFGQAVILLLIQFGGLGLVTLTVFITLALRKKLGFRDLQLSREYIGADGLMDVPKILRMIVTATLALELLGACILAIRFIPLYGLSGIWISIFLSVSAYCNAGFDILGREGEFVNLTNYVDDPLVIITISMLILLGGIGFLVFNDILTYKKNKRLMLHTKLVLIVTALIVVIGTILFMIAEYNNKETIGNQGFFGKLLASFFQIATARTAGFNSVNLDACYDPTKLLMCAVMFIGASSGSTGGGIKTTTFAVLVITVISVLRGRQDAVVLKKRVDKSVVYKAFTITVLSLLVVIITFLIIYLTTNIDGITTIDCLFESISAFSTCGLSCSATIHLGVWSRIALIITMFIGRVGPVSLVYTLTTNSDNEKSTKVLPEGKIIVG